MPFDLCLIVPCYNEEIRLPVDRFTHFLKHNPCIHLAFVNDGSSDGTRGVITRICELSPGNALGIDLDVNRGKGNAVYEGMAACLQSVDAPYFGYWDSDLSTPLESVFDFLDVFRTVDTAEMVTGCRLKRLGADIERSSLRHYVGRIFATMASFCLNLAVYDTQCGAKILSRNLAETVFRKEFRSRWIFDVEIYFRIIKEYSRPVQEIVYELPLKTWRNTKGSKVNFFSYLSSAIDLVKLMFYYRIKK